MAKYMVEERGPPSQGWKTFLHNHADGIASIDLFVVPTISFRLLYGFLIMQHKRRETPMARSDCPSDRRMDRAAIHRSAGRRDARRYMVRDRDRAYGNEFVRRVRAMGIRDRPTSARSPW